MQRVDTHVHLWSAEELPPWLNDPTLASIACSRSIADFISEAGPNLGSAVYMEVDVAPAARQREAQTVTALCADGSNPLVGAVIGAPVSLTLGGVGRSGGLENFFFLLPEREAGGGVK